LLTGEAGAATARDRLATALAHHRAGRTTEAAAGYRAIIDQQPNHADALNLLGILRLQDDAADEAAELIGRAVTVRPEVADYRNNLGEALRTLGRLDGAEEAFRDAIERDPSQANAHNNLGMVAMARGQCKAAHDWFTGAIALNDKVARYHANLGRASLELGDTGSAIIALTATCALTPNQADMHRMLGIAFHKAGRAGEALDSLRQAVALEPKHAATHSQIGLVLQSQDNLDGAVTAYRAALEIDPDFGEAANNLGVALADGGAPDQAVVAYRRALVHNANSSDTHNNMAMALQKLGLLHDAERHFERALECAPDQPDLLNNFGNLRIEQGRVADGLKLYERALEIDPTHDDAFVNLLARANLICDWDRQASLLPKLAARVAKIKAQPQRASSLIPLTFTLPYFSDDNGLISDVCRLVGGHFETLASVPIVRATRRDNDPERRLRIGYLSPDFGDHPISHVTLPIYRLHDRSEVDVTCYSTLDRSAAAGPYLAEIKEATDQFVDLSRHSFHDAAQRIADDRIDILVDMTGYMRHSRPQVLALHPAPLQLYWQGHTGSLGGSLVDYVIGDPTVMPPDEERYYAEKIIRLPDTFSSADRHPISDTPGDRADYGLPDDAIVFCAFNNPLKIERNTFDAWMRILAATPDSVLWLSRASEPAADNLRAAAETSAIDASRLVFATRVPDKRIHLARHALADLFLDTFHFNASTTALDALWAGLPTLTRRGNNAYSRLCTSYLTAVGLPELIVATTEAYVERAVALARDTDSRQNLKTKLSAQLKTAPLFDAARFTRHLEAAYRHIWQHHVAGKPPESFAQPVIRTG